MEFLTALDRAIVIGDGALGTELRAAGVPRESCLEELCVSEPDRVRAVHAAYLAAGAQLIRTNSRGANALRLSRHGFGQRVSEINWTAAQLAREMAKDTDAHVAGSVGPLGEPHAERQEIFLEQIGALLDAGVRIILLETFTELDEITTALEAKHTLHHCPVIASLAPREDARLRDGTALVDAFRRLRDAGADLVGVNCAIFDHALADALAACDRDLPIAVFPSAGLPVDTGGRLVYPRTAEQFAAEGVALARLGARLIGGCGGVGPAHLRSLVRSLAAAELISCS